MPASWTLAELAELKPKGVRWPWPGRIAYGKLTLLVGDLGLGKSWVTLDLAARVSVGGGTPADRTTAISAVRLGPASKRESRSVA